MKYRTLGRTGLVVSEIGFGCWAIGGPFLVQGRPMGWGPVDDVRSQAAILRALELGINFFDTADIYGLGHSESLLGQTLRTHRHSVVIASKAGNIALPDGSSRKDFSGAHLRQACEASLRRLQTDYLDLYQLHNPPLRAIWEGDAGETLERLQQEGKVRHFGVSTSHPAEGEEIIGRNFGATLQVVFNVLNQKPAGGLLGLACRSGYGIIARVPLASALLVGKIQSWNFHPQDNRTNFLTRRRLAEVTPKLQRYQELCRVHGERPVSAALRFILEHPAVGTAIPGAKTPEQVSENAAASGEHLPAALFESLQDEFRGYNFYLRYGIRV
ncbi:MAG: aldo/keto reductase [Acidobacteria bacterium]|nr:aldo/keto reductase [Acidobacteriota bacterium]